MDRNAEGRLTFGASAIGGVIGAGLNTSYAPTDHWRFDALAAAYYAHEDLSGGEQWYGWELDLEINYTIGRHYTLYAQAARFWHGDYFEALLDEALEPATLLLAGLRAEF